MRKIKNVGFVVHGLLILIGIFLIIRMPSSGAFFLLFTSSFLFLFFIKSLKIPSSINRRGFYEDQIKIIGFDNVPNKKPIQVRNTIESKSFHPMRFWSILMGLSHLMYGIKETSRMVITGNFPVISPMNGLLFIVKLLLLFSGIITFVYVVVVKYYTSG